MLHADLHVHTKYSMDSSNPLDKIITRCNETGINCLAISDHGTIEGAKELKEITSIKIIVAEEILTDCGEIMGMFLNETIPSGLTVEETVIRIKEQGGLICIPHPYDLIRPSALNNNALMRIIDQVDIIEIFNARNHFPNSNEKAKLLAARYNKLSSAGSDAHTIQEIGSTFVEMPDFNTGDNFLESLAQGTVQGHLSSPFVHFNSTANKIKKLFS